MTKLSLVPGGFTPEDFDRYVTARLGTGDPVYWYGIGDSSSFPAGNMVMRTEGYDTGRLYEYDKENCTATGLTRKMIVMRTVTGEIIYGRDGHPMWLNNFTYQWFRLRLENGYLVYKVQQGAGDLLNTVEDGLNRSEIQKFDGMTVYTTPVNYRMPLAEDGSIWEPVWETYDVIERTHRGESVYDGIWCGSFPVPPQMGGGRSTMHAYFHRYDSYGALPESIRSFVDKYAQLWKEPPKTLDEIHELAK